MNESMTVTVLLWGYQWAAKHVQTHTHMHEHAHTHTHNATGGLSSHCHVESDSDGSRLCLFLALLSFLLSFCRPAVYYVFAPSFLYLARLLSYTPTPFTPPIHQPSTVSPQPFSHHHPKRKTPKSRPPKAATLSPRSRRRTDGRSLPLTPP